MPGGGEQEGLKGKEPNTGNRKLSRKEMGWCV